MRVSNELGQMNPKKTRFSAMVSGATSLLVGIVFTLILILSKEKFPAIFTNSLEVQELVQELTPLLGISIIFTNVQYTLSGTISISISFSFYSYFCTHLCLIFR